MKASQDPRLSFCIEIHQGVAARQQIHVGDGSILNQIMAAEDDGAPEVGAEDVAARHAFKVFMPEVFRHGLDLPGAVTALAGPAESFFVHIGSIDLDPLAERFLPHGLAQHHGHGVRFLARGAAGAPDSDRVVVFLLGEDFGNDFLTQKLPGRRITEKAGDVNQKGVE